MDLKKSQRLIILYVLLLVGAVAFMAMLRGCSSSADDKASRIDGKSGGDTIDVAIDYSPMSMYSTDADTLGGLNYDIMRRVAEIAGIPVKYHPMTSMDEAMTGLENGLFDIVVADIPMTLDFQKRYRFSEPVYLDRQVLMQHVDTAAGAENEKIATVLDLAGRHVWVVANTPIEDRLRNLSAEIGDTIYVERSSEYGAELLALLTSIGEIRLCVINEQVAKAMAKDSPTVRVSTEVSFTQFQAWAMRAGNDTLASRIDSALVRFKSTPDYDALIRRYRQ